MSNKSITYWDYPLSSKDTGYFDKKYNYRKVLRLVIETSDAPTKDMQLYLYEQKYKKWSEDIIKTKTLFYLQIYADDPRIKDCLTRHSFGYIEGISHGDIMGNGRHYWELWKVIIDDILFFNPFYEAIIQEHFPATKKFLFEAFPKRAQEYLERKQDEKN